MVKRLQGQKIHALPRLWYNTAMAEDSMRTKPILPLLLSMAAPMILSMAVNSLYNIVDSFFVAKISEKAMTAISLVYPIQNVINAVVIGFGVGMAAVISYHLGAKDQEAADAAATRGLILNALHGLIMTVVCIAIIPAFLGAYTSDETILLYGRQYAYIVFSFAIVMGLTLSFEKIFQSAGKMVISMICMLIGCVSNIILDPMMIFGIGPFPAMGIRGAAIATVTGQSLNLLSSIIFYACGKIPVRLKAGLILPVKINNCELTDFEPAKNAGVPSVDDEISGNSRRAWDVKAYFNSIGRLYAIGIPAAMNLMLPSVLISVLNAILAGFSEVYVLVLGIYYKLQTFIYLSANGLIQGLRPLVGYNYGAKEYKRVGKIYSTGLILTAAIMAAGTLVCLIIPGKLIGLFTTNPDTIAVGITALRIICAGFIVSSVSVVSQGALEGLGKGVSALIIAACRYIIIIIPAAFILSRVSGAAAVWNAFWIAELICAAISLAVYLKAVRKLSA